MRNSLRGLAVILSMSFCLSVFPARILSADSKGTCGDGVKWEIEGDKLSISYTGSGTGVMDNYNDEIEEKIDKAGGDEEYIYHYNYPWQAYRNSISTGIASGNSFVSCLPSSPVFFARALIASSDRSVLKSTLKRFMIVPPVFV